MRTETRTCQSCRALFVIDASDFLFYEKMRVPPPTFCPACRLQRRLAFLNLFHLYQRACDLCRRGMISIYPRDAPYRVYCPTCWWSDQWDPFSYGREYDFSRPFFAQFNELLHEAPLIGLKIDAPTLVNSSYANFAGSLKNAYLLFMADFAENAAYGFYVNHVKDVLDCSATVSSELCYDSLHSYKNNRCAGLRSQVVNSLDSFFLRDCFNCQNCVASANLRNKQYCIFNRQYPRDEYFRELARWDMGSYAHYRKLKELAEEHWKKFPPKPTQEEFSFNVTGAQVFQSKNCKECFEVMGAEDSKYLLWLYDPPIKDCYDVTTWGNNLSLSYECCNVGEQSSGLKFCVSCGIHLVDAEYSMEILTGSHIFGCVAVRKGEYAILNKRYSPEAYRGLRAKIIAQMDEMPYESELGIRNSEFGKKKIVYRYGEFFPPELSPFAYNETIAENFFPLSREETEAAGYGYRSQEVRAHGITMKAADIPDHIRDVSDSILQEVISCNTCERGFKVIPMELQFLRARNFPLPRACPFCRIQGKFHQWVRDLRVISRACDACGAHFVTHYTREDAPVAYCKRCYQKEFG